MGLVPARQDLASASAFALAFLFASAIRRWNFPAVQARGVSSAVSPVSKLSEDSDVCVFRGDASPLYLSDSDQGSR